MTADDLQHAVNINMYTRFRDYFSVALTGRAVSGLPYTPLVAGDVNGDGLSNDRAFIFDPAKAGDPSTALGMSSGRSLSSSRCSGFLRSASTDRAVMFAVGSCPAMRSIRAMLTSS